MSANAASDVPDRETAPRLVAVVTGASRGVGRGIAAALGESGARVYVTGRSTRASGGTEGLPGTVEDTAELVTSRGGEGVAVPCDHADDAAVEALFARIEAERGRLDLLVNNVWGGYERHDLARFTAPLWEQPLRHWHGMFELGVRAHLVATRAAAPLLMRSGHGLVVSTVAWAFDRYLQNLFYDVAKAAIVRMTQDLAIELRPHGVAALVVAPGFVRTERVMAAHARQPFDLSSTESPEYTGRAIRALATDPDVMTRTGQLLTAGELARGYGFTDVDGRQPPPFRFSDDPRAARDRT